MKRSVTHVDNDLVFQITYLILLRYSFCPPTPFSYSCQELMKTIFYPNHSPTVFTVVLIMSVYIWSYVSIIFYVSNNDNISIFLELLNYNGIESILQGWLSSVTTIYELALGQYLSSYFLLRR